MTRRTSVGVALASLALSLSLFGEWAVRAQQPAAGSGDDGPRYTSKGELVRPTDYREWIFVSSGLGMTYGPAALGTVPRFDNVFVNPSSYRSFMKTGVWPDKTMFILEVRSSEGKKSINRDGRFQGQIAGIEAEVKDGTRYPDKWAYFAFGGGALLKESVAALPKTASCYSCHTQNTAVEQTFVQFYPTLFEVARRLGTVKPSYTEP